MTHILYRAANAIMPIAAPGSGGEIVERLGEALDAALAAGDSCPEVQSRHRKHTEPVQGGAFESGREFQTSCARAMS